MNLLKKALGRKFEKKESKKYKIDVKSKEVQEVIIAWSKGALTISDLAFSLDMITKDGRIATSLAYTAIALTFKELMITNKIEVS